MFLTLKLRQLSLGYILRTLSSGSWLLRKWSMLLQRSPRWSSMLRLVLKNVHIVTYLRHFMRNFEASQTSVGPENVHIIGFVDYNAPGARQASKSEVLAQGIGLCNDMGMSKQNVTMILLPDIPRDSSLRGLWDEEKQIMESLFAHKQHVDTRFVDLFTREPRGESRSAMRRFSAGRLVCSSDSKDENVWLDSELAICGRPTGRAEGENGAPCSVLPRSSALLLPEAGSPDADLKLADRARPSPEQTAAQKGQARLQLLVESMFRHSNIKSPCLIVNLTGYVEELAAAASSLCQFCLFQLKPFFQFLVLSILGILGTCPTSLRYWIFVFLVSCKVTAVGLTGRTCSTSACTHSTLRWVSNMPAHVSAVNCLMVGLPKK